MLPGGTHARRKFELWTYRAITWLHEISLKQKQRNWSVWLSTNLFSSLSSCTPLTQFSWPRHLHEKEISATNRCNSCRSTLTLMEVTSRQAHAFDHEWSLTLESDRQQLPNSLAFQSSPSIRSSPACALSFPPTGLRSLHTEAYGKGSRTAGT